MTHICVSDQASIGSDNGLSPGRSQAIIRTNAGILLIRPLGTNFSEFLVEILIFSFRKMHLKISSGKWRIFRLGLNVLINNTLKCDSSSRDLLVTYNILRWRNECGCNWLMQCRPPCIFQLACTLILIDFYQ